MIAKANIAKGSDMTKTGAQLSRATFVLTTGLAMFVSVLAREQVPLCTAGATAIPLISTKPLFASGRLSYLPTMRLLHHSKHPTRSQACLRQSS